MRPVVSLSVPRLFRAPNIKVDKSPQSEYKPKSYSQFIKSLEKKELPQVLIKPSKNIAIFTEKDGNYGDAAIVQSDKLWEILIDSEANINIDTTQPQNLAENVIIAFFVLYAFTMFRAIFGSKDGGGMGMPNPFLKSAEFDMEQAIETRFTDVEGIDSAKYELEEIVDFLKNPERYLGSGAKIPRGALLSGSPGTGKTLLARAIAGESSVPFIQCSAASFVEMFVGVGAKRVRELFEQARMNQPCIVFIDEIDAVGKKRASGPMPGNDEREQTINQLLTEMDGFDENTGIVVIAATNRSDILDEALLRPGRFDRKIQVSLPSVRGRKKILKVHARGKKLDKSVSLGSLAKQTTGFSGAELANLLNECAIRGVRDGDGTITEAIVDDVYQRLIVGAKGDTTFTGHKKEVIAFHEAGHAITGAVIPGYDRVRKVSIIPRGAAGGVTFFQPSEENAESALYTKQYLKNQMVVALGGRAAEELIYGADNITTGASSDYAQVYNIAREMVTTYGLGINNFDYRNLSPTAALMVDKEISDLVSECYKRSKELLSINMLELKQLKEKLIEDELVDGSWVYELFGGTISCNSVDAWDDENASCTFD
jgi:cell division protease FtsH